MISYTPVEAATLPVIRVKLMEGKRINWSFHVTVENSGGFGGSLNAELKSSNFVESKPKVIDAPEDFDWSSKKIVREFIELEQKSLANRTSREEMRRYETMRTNCNKSIFADRYVQDYAEIQRLKILSEKLLELQKYLRPIY